MNNNILKGIVITLFVVGLIWTVECVLTSNTAYIVLLIKSTAKKSLPGIFLMLPAIIWLGWHTIKKVLM